MDYFSSCSCRNHLASVGFIAELSLLPGVVSSPPISDTGDSHVARPPTVLFVSESLRDNLVEASIEQAVQGSDHCPVSLTLDL